MLLKDDYDIIISSSYIINKLSPFKSSPRKFILIKIEQVSCNIIIEFLSSAHFTYRVVDKAFSLNVY